MDKVDKGLFFFEFDSDGRREHSYKLFKKRSRLTPGNIPSVIESSITGILYLKIVWNRKQRKNIPITIMSYMQGGWAK